MSYLTGVIEDRTAVCTFAIAETDPRPRCTNPATRHVALLAADLVSLHAIAACDEHVATAREAAGESCGHTLTLTLTAATPRIDVGCVDWAVAR